MVHTLDIHHNREHRQFPKNDSRGVNKININQLSITIFGISKYFYEKSNENGFGNKFGELGGSRSMFKVKFGQNPIQIAIKLV